VSIQKKNDKVERYLQYYLLGRNDEYEEGQVATTLGFGSCSALYEQLARDGFPVCPVCGETPAGSKHCKTPRRRKPKPSDGEVVELPPARDSIPLFERVAGFRSDDEKPRYGFAIGLHRLCEDLMHLEEELHGKRFVSNRVYRPESAPPFETLRREDYSEEEWARICEEFSQPDIGEELNYYDTPDAPSMKTYGASSKAPWRGLVVLISTYLLMGRPVQPLLDVLHPDPSRFDGKQPEDEEQRKAREQLEKKVGQLELLATQVATLIRGGTVKQSPPTEGLSGEELELAYEITEMKERGFSYDQIYERLRERELDDPQQDTEWEYSRGYIENLGKFNLRRPDYWSPAP
jgi:hypothetical protein